MAVAMDLPDPNSPYQCIHPRDKTDVAERLTLGARAVAYGENIYWTGPIAHFAAKEESKIRITFKPRSLYKKGIEIRSKKGFEVSSRKKLNAINTKYGKSISYTVHKAPKSNSLACEKLTKNSRIASFCDSGVL